MAKEVKIDVITKETIKPSSPTPDHLRKMKLSLFDQICIEGSTPMVLFYPEKNTNSGVNDVKVKSEQFKSSLSKVLTLFYPLAGTVVENSYVECNDKGIEYVEAQVGCLMNDVFEQPNVDLLEKLIPVELHSNESLPGAKIQVNYFQCGGFAIGITLSHRITDAFSLSTFTMAWASMSLFGETSPEFRPHFVSDTYIPSVKDLSIFPSRMPPPIEILEGTLKKNKTIRFGFDPAKIALLRANSESECVKNPTRVEAVTAFIWKCLMTISRQSPETDRESFVVNAVNLRKRVVPQLPDNYVGNLSGKFTARTTEKMIELPHLVSQIRKGLAKLSEEAAMGMKESDIPRVLEFAKEFGELHRRSDVDLYNISSLCRIPLYGADFGWGKPSWIILTNLVLKNYGLLIDTRDGQGIEVWISLSEEDAALLEKNHELLEFATMNPSVRV